MYCQEIKSKTLDRELLHKIYYRKYNGVLNSDEIRNNQTRKQLFGKDRTRCLCLGTKLSHNIIKCSNECRYTCCILKCNNILDSNIIKENFPELHNELMNNLFLECKCCEEVVESTFVIKCSCCNSNNEHVFCKDCINSYINVGIGDNIDNSKVCIMKNDCKGHFDMDDIRNFVDKTRVDKLLEIEKSKNVPKQILYIQDINSTKEEICKKVDEFIDILSINLCPKCSTSFIKEEGCNLMKCNQCHTSFCYLCSEILQDGDHSHFLSKGSYEGLCVLYNDQNNLVYDRNQGNLIYKKKKLIKWCKLLLEQNAHPETRKIMLKQMRKQGIIFDDISDNLMVRIYGYFQNLI